MSVASISGVVVWKAASVANQISDLEAKVAVIEQNTGTDSSVLAKLEEISDGVQENENVQFSSTQLILSFLIKMKKVNLDDK